MPVYLKQSTASQEVPLGYFVDSVDGNSEEVSLTINNTDIKLHKAGATALANKNSGGATHISNGIYYAVLDATDTDTLGSLIVFVHVSGALPVRLECVVLAANVYDGLIGGGDVLQVDISQWNNANLATPDTAGYPKVTVKAGTGTGEVSLSSGTVTVGTNSDKTGYGLADGAITAAKIADGALTAVKFASGAFDAVWSVAARLLTAGTNIVLAKGTGVTGFTDLDAGGVRSAVGLASANLDTQLDALPTAAENATAAWAAGTRTLTAGTNIALAKGTGVTGFNDLSAADVNAEVLDVLVTDTFAEPGSVPAATSSLKDKISWLFALSRNKRTQSGTTQTLRNDADNASIATSSTTDNGTTYTSSEWS